MSTPNTTTTASSGRTFMQRLNWLGGKIIDIAESIGEGVVSILGLDDSHFQDVLDNMTEEEIQTAVEVNNQRNDEYRRAGILPPQSELPLDLTVEEVQMELIEHNTRPYSAVETETYDIEGAPIRGRTARPVTAVTRSDTDGNTSGGFTNPRTVAIAPTATSTGSTAPATPVPAAAAPASPTPIASATVEAPVFTSTEPQGTGIAPSQSDDQGSSSV